MAPGWQARLGWRVTLAPTAYKKTWIRTMSSQHTETLRTCLMMFPLVICFSCHRIEWKAAAEQDVWCIHLHLIDAYVNVFYIDWCCFYYFVRNSLVAMLCSSKDPLSLVLSLSVSFALALSLALSRASRPYRRLCISLSLSLYLSLCPSRHILLPAPCQYNHPYFQTITDEEKNTDTCSSSSQFFFNRWRANGNRRTEV